LDGEGNDVLDVIVDEGLLHGGTLLDEIETLSDDILIAILETLLHDVKELRDDPLEQHDLWLIGERAY
jgi:hypothetical protein